MQPAASSNLQEDAAAAAAAAAARRESEDQAMAIKAEVDYQRLFNCSGRQFQDSRAMGSESRRTSPGKLNESPRRSIPSVEQFNHYDTQLVKVDANTNGHSQPDDLIEPNMMALNQAGHGDFRLLSPNDTDTEYEPPTPTDSISNKSFTDVTFIVGPPQHSKKYVGHRVLLAMTSPVFETMFYGDMADKNKYIRVPDVAPIGFENLLRYAYTDCLNLGSVEDAMMTAYAAKKYLLPQLLRECLSYIELNISPSTACVVFEFAHVLNSQQLVLQSMNLIDRQINSIITNKSFNHVQASTVEFVANRKYLNLSSEYALFQAMLSWSVAEVRRRGLPNTEWPIIRSVMQDTSLLRASRFLAMTPEEVARVIVKTSASIVVKNSSGNGGETKSAGAGSENDTDDHSAQSGGDLNGTSDKLEQIVNVEDKNRLLTGPEQRALLLNLVLDGQVARLPQNLNSSRKSRQAPPEYFSVSRFRSSPSGSMVSQVATTTTTRNLKSIGSMFQCLSENVFIVALTIPIRLDASSYATRTPKFECHLKFTTKPSNSAVSGGPVTKSDLADEAHQTTDQALCHGDSGAGSSLVMDTIDESLHISISRDRDCLVRLKRPILVKMTNVNELRLTFQTYALDEDIVALRAPKNRAANFSEQTDSENISWLFFKTPGLEFSEIHYYY